MDRLAFLRAFVAHPGRIGSVTPSSASLARAVVAAAAVPTGGRVVELGPGTGPMTAVLRAEHPDARLVAFEADPALAARLRTRFPSLTLVETPAGPDLATVAAGVGLDTVDRVVSGLPWTLWTDAVQDAVLSGVTDALVPDGRFVTYTYVHGPFTPNGRRFRRTLDRWFGRVTRTPVVWANLPPAFVVVAEAPRRAARR